LIEKKFEFRVHVAFERVIKVSQKIYDPSKGKPYNPTVWNYRNGFVFKNPRLDDVHNDIEFLDRVKEIGVESVAALGLDFGAVDIIATEDQVIYVLEINTAPGVKALSTANAYADAFESQIISLAIARLNVN